MINKKIIAVSSIGGHWIQLLRLTPAFTDCQVEFITTNKNFASMVEGYKFYHVEEGSRKNLKGLLKCYRNIFKILKDSSPDVIITTGAAPGLMAIIAGTVLRKKTIWIDSIANCEKLSMSGTLAGFFTANVYTQWKHLATKKVKYNGNVLGA
ncbi:hypothetical protein ACG2LH_17710 [Zhouia sp. PK063]|uniref:hypothetical protein n=1 Tax=Zhouia sp. PK063 TaxID=3373602 RepID=UPI00378E75D8